MPFQSFENLKHFFHMNDNLKMPKRGEYNFDHIYKVRALLDCILERCSYTEQEEATEKIFILHHSLKINKRRVLISSGGADIMILGT